VTIKKLTIEIPEELFNRFFSHLIRNSETGRQPTFQEVNVAGQRALVDWLDKEEKTGSK